MNSSGPRFRPEATVHRNRRSAALVGRKVVAAHEGGQAGAVEQRARARSEAVISPWEVAAARWCPPHHAVFIARMSGDGGGCPTRLGVWALTLEAARRGGAEEAMTQWRSSRWRRAGEPRRHRSAPASTHITEGCDATVESKGI
jgi:hypothetical protein